MTNQIHISPIFSYIYADLHEILVFIINLHCKLYYSSGSEFFSSWKHIPFYLGPPTIENNSASSKEIILMFYGKLDELRNEYIFAPQLIWDHTWFRCWRKRINVRTFGFVFICCHFRKFSCLIFTSTHWFCESHLRHFFTKRTFNIYRHLCVD